MSEQRYMTNIITNTSESSYDQEKSGHIMMKDKTSDESTIRQMHILRLDQEKVKDASMYMECIWLLESKAVSETIEKPHVHEFDEVIGFIGTDRKNPYDLDSKIEILLGDETHPITKSCLIHIPAGMKHCHPTFREITKPVFFCTLAFTAMSGPYSDAINSKGLSDPSKEKFTPPEPDSSGTRYGRYVITYRRPGVKLPTAEVTSVVSMDDSIFKEAFYIGFGWIWNGTFTMLPGQGHSHDFDEIIGLIGFDQDYSQTFDGEVNMMMDDDKYQLTESNLIFIPKGLKHCPLELINIRKPMLFFLIGNTTKYSIKY